MITTIRVTDGLELVSDEIESQVTIVMKASFGIVEAKVNINDLTLALAKIMYK